MSLGYINIETDGKLKKFIITNYKAFTERPAFDPKSEFIVQVVLPCETLVWYGPISLNDLYAFIRALPIEEMVAFARRVKGEKNGDT